MDALSVKNLTKSYGDFTLDHVTFSLPQGCIMGLIGENGAGKSTTIKLILDLIHRDSGEITLLGRDSTQLTREDREHLGVILDECYFPDNLNLKNINTILRSTYRTWDKNRFQELTTRFSLPEGKSIKDYSRGMKMKLSVAVALSHDSRLLLLDEATSGLDPVVREELLDLLLEFIQEEDRAILLSSHILSDLEKVCDYITFLHRGKLILCEEKDVLLDKYGVLKCSQRELERLDNSAVFGVRRSQFGVEALVDRRRVPPGLTVDRANMEDIMLYLIKGEEK